jgi:membrane-associated phospholipid phosphatase
MPNGYWQHFPESLKSWDQRISERIELSEFHRNSALVSGIEFFTENPVGILSVVAVFLGIFYLISKKRHKNQLSLSLLSRRGLGLLTLFFMSLGLSDFLGSFLKSFFGRLKPHVEFFNPALIPALSFPSNHALNNAFLCYVFCFVFLKFSFPDAGKRFVRLWRVAFYSYFCFICWSRIALGEHYLLDVLFGGLIGTLLGFLFYKFTQRFIKVVQ